MKKFSPELLMVLAQESPFKEALHKMSTWMTLCIGPYGLGPFYVAVADQVPELTASEKAAWDMIKEPLIDSAIAIAQVRRDAYRNERTKLTGKDPLAGKGNRYDREMIAYFDKIFSREKRPWYEQLKFLIRARV